MGTVTKTLQYLLGFEYGLQFRAEHVKIRKILGKNKVEILRKISSNIFMSVGYEIMETIEIKNPPYCRLRIYNCFECEVGKGEGKHTVIS